MNKRKLRLLSIFFILISLCVKVYSLSPSLDGRAVVVDEGVFPQGLFAKTVGYLPGDIISVTNISGETTVDILVIGALDPSEGVAIMLSPEAAKAIGIDVNANNIVKITKRSNQDERVYGSAVIAKANSTDSSDNSKPSVQPPASNQEDEVEWLIDDEPQTDIQTVIVEETEDEESADNEPQEEIIEEEVVVPQEIEEDTFDENNIEETPAEEVIEENEESPVEETVEEQTEEPAEELPVEEEQVEEEVQAEEFEADELEAIEEETPVEEVIEDTEELPVEEEQVEEEIQAEEFEADELEAIEEETPAEEVIEETEEPAEEETVEEQTEEPAEELPVEEEPAEEVIEENSEEEPDEAIIVDLPPVVQENHAEAMPVEEAPVEQSFEENMVEEAIEETPVEETIEEASVDENQIEEAIDLTPVEETVEDSSVEQVIDITADDKLVANKYYIQIAVLKNQKLIQEIVNKYGKNYPVVVIPLSNGNSQVLIGPLTVDEYGAVLERFKAYGYKDAFVRKIK